MSLVLLKRAGAPWRDGLMIHYLLAPDLPEEHTNEQVILAIMLANMWRIRRDRPYVVACVEDESRATNSYVQTLDTRRVENTPSTRPLIYVGTGDVSPVVPRTEDDSLLFFRDVPPPILPSWPKLITELDAVQLSRADEFVKITTTDAEVCKLLDELPMT